MPCSRSTHKSSSKGGSFFATSNGRLCLSFFVLTFGVLARHLGLLGEAGVNTSDGWNGSGGVTTSRSSLTPNSLDSGAAPHLERGKLISKKATSNELYQAYKEIVDEYNEKAFDEKYKSRWEVLKETKDGIQISMLHHDSDPLCPYVRMTAIMPGSIEDSWNFLSLANWEKNLPIMDPFYEGHSIHGNYHQNNVDMILVRKRLKRILAFGKRDLTFLSISDNITPHDNGAWVSGTVSVITDKLPRQSGYVRAFQDSIGFYEPYSYDEVSKEHKTRLTLVCRIDLNDSAEGGEGGAIPMWIYVKTVGSVGVVSMKSMKDEIGKAVELRKKNEDASKEEKGREISRNTWGTQLPIAPWVFIKKGDASARR